MRKIILSVIAVIVAIIAIVLIVAAFQPAAFRVERSASIAASPAVLFAQVNDHKKFQRWNPWAKMDPDATTTYSGPFMGKLVSLFMDCEKICGPEFEKGLADLGKIVAAPANP
jgi:hypothetical protein